KMINISSTPKIKNIGYFGLSKNYLKCGRLDQAIMWAKKSEKLSNENSLSLEFLQSLAVITQVLQRKGLYAEALKNILYAQSVLKNINKMKRNPKDKIDFQKEEGKIFMNMAMGCLYQRKHQKALKLLNKALIIFKKYDDLLNTSATISNIGNIYNELGKFTKALEYYNKSLKIKETIGDKNGISTTLYNMTRMLSMLGKYDNALITCKKSLSISKSIGDIGGINFSLLALGILYQNLGKYDKALSLYEESLKIGKKTKDPYTLTANLIYIGKIYLARGEYDKCEGSLEKSEKFIRHIKNPYLLIETIIEKANYHFETNSPIKAYNYLEEVLLLTQKHKIPSDRMRALSLFVRLIIRYGSIGTYTIKDTKKFLSEISAEQEKNTDLLVDILPAFIEYYIYIGEYKKALKQSEIFLGIVRKNNSINSLSLALLLISKTYLYTEKNPSKYLKEAEKFAEKRGLKPLLREIRKLWKKV
ncbi:tetratricopeptide repeat protein, partial [candidate division WOR-3 bacterium]|nr:tetratricopeptide repeat protein [candidate division WOR-3 bacterium]